MTGATMQELDNILGNFYGSIINSIPVGVVTVNDDLIVASVNATFDELTGIWGRNYLGRYASELFDELLTPRQIMELVTGLRSILRSKETFAIEIEPDVLDRILRFEASPLVGDAGHVMGLVIVLDDITERQRAEDTLRRMNEQLEERVRQRTSALAISARRLEEESEQRKRVQEALYERRRMLHLIISSIPNIMLHLNEHNRIAAFFVPNYLQHISRAYQFETGKSINDLFPPDTSRLFARLIESARRTGQVQTVEHTLAVDGQQTHFRVKVATITNSEDVLILADDITGLKEVEDALRRRDMILEAVATITEELLLAHPGAVMPDLLARLGEASRVDRVYVFKNHRADDGTLLTSQLYEWTADGIKPHQDQLVFHNFAYLKNGFGRWVKTLGAGEPLHGSVHDMPESERAVLEGQAICSLALVPIFSGGTWWGLLGFDQCDEERNWSNAEIEALRSVAGAIGAAFYRERIRAAEREQRTLAEALRDSAAVLSSTLDIEEVLERILTNVGRVVRHDSANIMLIDRDATHIVRAGGGSRTTGGLRTEHFPLQTFPRLGGLPGGTAPIIIGDVDEYSGWVQLPWAPGIHAYAGAPIYLKDELIGYLNLYSETPGFFSEEHAERLHAFADQAAIAISNARLYDQAQALAAVEERQRLARELHDGVSQSLGSAKLIADVLPRIWEQNPARAEQALGHLGQLTVDALVEMRMLLMELRPDALAGTELDELLTRLTQIAMSRRGIPVELEMGGDIALPDDVKLALYRVAQEGLNNVVKHSLATRAAVSLHAGPENVVLCVEDDGRGFDFKPDDVPTDHFGLRIMRERMAEVGGTLQIESHSGKGTTITASWPRHRRENGYDAG
jgi:PAS domain S-box-containing protein